MITIFNRKELLVTMDMNQQANVRNILSANGVDYTTKVTNLQSPSVFENKRGRYGSFGINQNILMNIRFMFIGKTMIMH